MNSMKRVLPQPVGPLRISGMWASKAARKTTSSSFWAT